MPSVSMTCWYALGERGLAAADVLQVRADGATEGDRDVPAAAP